MVIMERLGLHSKVRQDYGLKLRFALKRYGTCRAQNAAGERMA
jgi:hypothetical protein